MGDNFNPLNPGDPFGLFPDPGDLLGGGGGGNSGTRPSVSSPGTAGSGEVRTPNLFKPYQQYIPQAMNTAGPIRDPNAILRAYADNMPAFRAASSQAVPSVQESLSAREQGK